MQLISLQATIDLTLKPVRANFKLQDYLKKALGLFYLSNLLVSQETILIINAPQNAGQKPRTVNPSTKVATNQKNKALITKAKKPRVNIVIGNEKK